MNDILSNYYKTQYCKTNTKTIENNILTPNRYFKIKPDTTAINLSPYGIYLSENNALLISRKNTMSPLSLKFTNSFKPLEKNFSHNIKNSPEERNLSLTSNMNNTHKNNLDHKLVKCFSYKKKNKILLHKLDNINNKEKLKNKRNIKTFIINKNEKINDNKKSRNNFNDFSIIKTDGNYHINTSHNFRTLSNISKNRTYYKTIKKEKKDNNMFYKETKKDKINNKIEAEKIINELLNLKTNKDIKSYYIKKDYEKLIAAAGTENNNNIQIFNKNNSIDPMTYIKFNLSNHPRNNKLFKSFDSQIMIMGNKKYRNDLFDGVNLYKNNFVKYKDLRGPIGFDKNKINEKKRNEVIKKMKMNYIVEKGLVFSNKLYKRKYNIKNDLVFDGNYKDVEKFLYKDIDKYDSLTKIDNGKKVNAKVDKNDINILKRISGEAEYIIQDKDEMIKFSNRFLSFNERINKLLSKTKNTTDFLSQRAKEHHKIKKKIDQIYNNI